MRSLHLGGGQAEKAEVTTGDPRTEKAVRCCHLAESERIALSLGHKLAFFYILKLFYFTAASMQTSCIRVKALPKINPRSSPSVNGFIDIFKTEIKPRINEMQATTSREEAAEITKQLLLFMAYLHTHTLKYVNIYDRYR